MCKLCVGLSRRGVLAGLSCRTARRRGPGAACPNHR